MHEDPKEVIIAAIAEFRDAALARGFKPPLYLTQVTADGVMMFFRSAPADGEDDGELIPVKLADHWPVDTFRTPFTMMLTDSTGEVALMRVRGPGAEAEPEVIWPNELPEMD